MFPASWVRNGTVGFWNAEIVCFSLTAIIFYIRSEILVVESYFFFFLMRESRAKGMSTTWIISQGLEIQSWLLLELLGY